jgi:hypothetical protein
LLLKSDVLIFHSSNKTVTAATLPPVCGVLAANFLAVALLSVYKYSSAAVSNSYALKQRMFFRLKFVLVWGSSLYPPASSVCKGIQQQIFKFKCGFSN